MYCEKNRGSKNRPNDGAFYSAWHYTNSDPHHMTLSLSESQDAILLHILFSDYYLIYLFFDRPIFSKHQNIGTVFLPTVCVKQRARLAALGNSSSHPASSSTILLLLVTLSHVIDSIYIDLEIIFYAIFFDVPSH